MTPDEIKTRIADLTRQANDLLAQLVQPLQQLSAWQAQIALLNEMLPKDETGSTVRGPNGQ